MSKDKATYGRLERALHIIKPFCKQFCPMLVWLILSSLWALLIWIFIPQVRADYELKAVAPTVQTAPVTEPIYSYYLDFSPSMEGFFTTPVGAAAQMVPVLNEVNKNDSSSYFYYCGPDLMAAEQTLFYSCLQTGSALREYYRNLSIPNDQWATEGVSSTKLEQELARLDLSNLFTTVGTNNRQYASDQRNLNVIITDLNFLQSADDTSGHVQRLEEFARRISAQASSSNLCIYHLRSNFQGITDDLFLDSPDLSSQRLQSASLFVIILAQNNQVFDNYLEQWEAAFSKYNLSYSDKLLLKISPTGEGQPLEFNEVAFFDSEVTVRSGFNFANGLLDRRPNYAIGLQLQDMDTATARIQLPVTRLDALLPGVRTQSGLADSSFEVQTSVVRPTFLGLQRQEIPELDGILLCRAYAGDYQDTAQLFLDLSANAQARPSNLLCKNYYVADIQFFTSRMVFSLPEWVETLNTGEWPGDEGKILNVNDFFQQLLSAKGTDYASLPASQRCLGSVAVYIFYN